jgi:hypothetical protein
MKRDLDIDSFYGALESKKGELNISWRALATELELPDHTVFTRLSKGQVPDAATLLTLSAWLGVPLETYARGHVEAPDATQGTLEAIQTFLRADRALTPDSADAITSVLRAAYDQLARPDEIEEAAVGHPESASAT